MAAAAAGAAEVARAHAAAVDRDAVFPAAALAALREARLLAALVPVPLGGLGLPLGRVGAICSALAEACSSTAMIFAMHQVQVACLARHALDQEWHRHFLRRVAADGLLLASANSEAGIGGDLRTSRCAVLRDGGRFTVRKQTTALSYGAHADALLLTARRGEDAAPTDQVLLVALREDCTLERTAGWDALGMRGTCTEGFLVDAAGSEAQILATPFGTIAGETMVPASHLLWCSLWVGIAADAVGRARSFVRAAVRGDRSGAAPPGGPRLALAVEQLQMLQAQVTASLQRFEAQADAEPASLAAAIESNALKTGVSEACLAVVQNALRVCGFAGYSNAGRYSLSRHLRDLQSAPLMINNDRMRDTTARLLLAAAPVLGIV
ncbi:MAG: acyl-CoA/acyl-ACP dehydrogenase [Acidisphaera sp.]|nr:acyl-CoA/acyl-ACP dehydrogenase [Acidisphaera sp.]